MTRQAILERLNAEAPGLGNSSSQSPPASSHVISADGTSLHPLAF